MNDKPTKPASGKAAGGRPVTRHMPEKIPDSMQNIAKAIMQGPPKKDWRYLEKKGK